MRIRTSRCLPLLSLLWPIAASAAPPEVAIAAGPLFSGQANVHPNVLLTLSVEFPTAGIAYRGDGGTYNRTTEYVGYFNPAKCYDYHGGNRNLSDDAYFFIAKDADLLTHECGGGAFSGNFLNWAASSAIDMLRYALTGGDRVVDTADMTVLQRAMLQDSQDVNFYAHDTYFPRRVLVGKGNASPPGQVTPFNVGKLYIVSCRNRILFSDTSSGFSGSGPDAGKPASGYCMSKYDGTGNPPKEAQDKRLGEYLVRVRVCDAAEAAQRTDLCLKYGAGYKPAGEIQRRAASLRIGAMGYLLDDDANRYGGVLRAPIKYAGPRRLEAPAWIDMPNDRAEWDEKTGIFYPNPEDPSHRNSATANSGVVNYLNKFGRSGKYKTYDPVGELFYEGVRYLQGKQPTPDATAGMAEAMKDGFPVVANWTDPVIASCQANYIVTIADVNTHWDRYVPGNDRTTFAGGADAHDSSRPVEPAVDGRTPALDVKKWTRLVGAMESDVSTVYGNPAPNPALANLQDLDTGAGGHGTYYMAGLAFWANTNDIRLDKPTRIKTIAIDVDEGGNGLIDGNARTLKPRNSQLYLAAKYGGFDDRNADGNPFATLAADGKTLVRGSDAEWGNGAGVPANYFLAGQPKELIQSIRKIFARIGGTSGTVSGVAATSARISSDGAYVYEPGFDAWKWSGSLKKFAVSVDANGSSATLSATPVWDAGETLTGTEGPQRQAPLPAPDARSIFTLMRSEESAATVAFRWDQLSGEQKVWLNASPQDGNADGLGPKRVDYLRGDRSFEAGRPGGQFRARERVLGDIINSNALFVGAPVSNMQGEGYAEHVEAHKTRRQAVYVGANDGMLHAFAADTGQELFAYVPHAVFPALARLTLPEYEHRPYVDGTLAAGEAYVRGKWRTVLAAGMGGGAQGVFALDVSDPANFAGGAGALFEFTDNDDPDMGNLMGAPVIAKFKTGGAAGEPVYKYFVVAASGYNNYRPDGAARFNADAASALFLLSLDKPAGDKWQQGVNYFKFRFPASDAALPNGLATPALVADAAGAVHHGYAGDLQGNLWRLDFGDGAPWPKLVPNHGPLFVARDDGGKRQPISAQPKVVFGPGGGYVVLFGTGKFVEAADAAPGNFATQSFYAVLDAAGSDAAAALARGDLSKRTLAPSSDGYTVAGDLFSYGKGGSQKKGWYFDFPASDRSGERLIASPVAMSGMLFFNSLIPSADPCGAGGGRSYVLDALSGMPAGAGPTGILSRVGMLSAPIVFQTANVVGDRDVIGRRSVTKKYAIINFGTGGGQGMAAPAGADPAQATVQVTVPAGRLSWREIPNWKELKATASQK